MQIKLESLIIPWYNPRKEVDSEYFDELKESMKNSGQWDDILVRRSDNGKYEIISGSQRFKAASELGWLDISSKVLDISEEEATLLSIETNLVRKDLKEIEEGKAIQKIMTNFNLSEKQIAEKIHRSRTWVNQRLSLVLNVTKEVRDSLEKGKINLGQALLFADFSSDEQIKFLKYILNIQKEEGRNLTIDETKIHKIRYLNDTIYTIGFSGWKIDEFFKSLIDNKIEVIVDVRAQGRSQYKPEFNSDVLEKECKLHGIKYVHRPEFGVPSEIRDAVKQGGLSMSCFEQWYTWSITKKDEVNNLEKLTLQIKELGRSTLMCSEHYPVENKDQKYGCHRNILADKIISSELFTKRKDLILNS